MPRRNLEYIKGKYYHIYNRGIAGQSIFFNDQNYLFALRLIGQVAAECELSLIAYCLLPNTYLRNLCRYIHCNAVRHGIAAAPELWPYSNYLDWIGRRQGKLLDRNFIKAHFGTAEAYKDFVHACLTGQAQLQKHLIRYLESLWQSQRSNLLALRRHGQHGQQPH